VQTNREFAYERWKRDIQAITNLSDAKETACKFLSLYLNQQEVVDSMIKKGWLPSGKATHLD